MSGLFRVALALGTPFVGLRPMVSIYTARQQIWIFSRQNNAREACNVSYW